MMLVVLSDTHGNVFLMEKALRMSQTLFADMQVIHLGDNWEDKEYLEKIGYAVSAVPGLWCPEYHHPHIPRARVEDIAGIKIAFAHTEADLPSPLEKVELLLCGHTHRYRIDLRNGIPFMNPGHLKREKDRGQPASFGIVQRDETSLHLSILDLSGVVLQEQRFPRTTQPLSKDKGPGGWKESLTHRT